MELLIYNCHDTWIIRESANKFQYNFVAISLQLSTRMLLGEIFENENLVEFEICNLPIANPGSPVVDAVLTLFGLPSSYQRPEPG